MTFHNFQVDIPYRNSQTIESEIERFIFENPAILLSRGRFIEPDTTVGLELHFCSVPENLQFDGSAGHAEAFGPSAEHMSIDFEFTVSSISLDSTGAQATVALRITKVERLFFREENIKEKFLVMANKPNVKLWEWACGHSEERYRNSKCDDEKTMWELANLNGQEWEETKAYAKSIVLGSGC